MGEKIYIDKHWAIVGIWDKVYVSSEELKMDWEIWVVVDLLTADHIVFPFRVRFENINWKGERTLGLKSSEVELLSRGWEELPYYCIV